MARNRFAPDRGLVSRMVVVMFLLGLLYVAFIAALVALQVSLIAIIILVGGFFLLQYYASDRIALFAMNGRIVSEQEAPELHAIVDRLCALSNSPKPKVAIADTDIPNAFATGRNQKRAVVCATTGLLRRLDPEEIEGVLAHEMSHVAHRDVAVMTIASFLGVVAGFISRWAMYAGMFGGYDRRDRNENGALVAFFIMIISMIVYAISFLLIRALSRYRELSADRSGALLTGRPSALASALQKVTGAMARIPTRDLRAAEAFNAFFFTPALAEGFSLSTLFSTHPPLEKRLAQLAKLSRELGEI
ncbi:MAG: zinc metalloprotease HtpX [Acidothermus sp.]|nr:zinc metalloprotease HtpX [Acidothermus sp.]